MRLIRFTECTPEGKWTRSRTPSTNLNENAAYPDDYKGRRILHTLHLAYALGPRIATPNDVMGLHSKPPYGGTLTLHQMEILGESARQSAKQVKVGLGEGKRYKSARDDSGCQAKIVEARGNASPFDRASHYHAEYEGGSDSHAPAK